MAIINRELVKRIVGGRFEAESEYLWDDKVPGFGIRLRGTPTYILQTRRRKATGGSEVVRRTLGKVPLMPLDDARTEAMEAIAALKRDGRDLMKDRRRPVRSAPDPEPTDGRGIDALVNRYLARCQKHRSIANIRWFAKLAGTALAEFDLVKTTAADAVRLRQKIEALEIRASQRPDETRTKPASPDLKRHVWNNARKIVDLLVEDGTIPTNPLRERAVGTVKGSRSRSRVLSLEELGTLWRAAGEGVYGDCFRCLMALPVRRDELAHARWSQVDFDAGVFTIPAALAKSGEDHTLPLGTLAWLILSDRKDRDAKPEDFIFPLPADPKKPINSFGSYVVRLNQRLVKAGTPVREWRIHDFRRAFVSALGDLKHDEVTLDLILSHRQSSTRRGALAVYQHSRRWSDQERAMEDWCALLGKVGMTWRASGPIAA